MNGSVNIMMNRTMNRAVKAPDDCCLPIYNLFYLKRQLRAILQDPYFFNRIDYNCKPQN